MRKLSATLGQETPPPTPIDEPARRPAARAGWPALGRFWPVVVSLLALWATVGFQLAASLPRNDGHLIYALDDAYIHMAMARHLVEHGVWGVTPHGFSSSSSSPLWTALLAVIYRVTGVNDVAPFLVNLASATALLIVVQRLLTAWHVSRWAHAPVLLGIVFLTPLPVLIFVGMEHTLHIVLTVTFAALAADRLARPATSTGPARWRAAAPLLALAPLLVMTRYEGLFLIGVAALLFAWRRRLGEAALLAGLAGAPVLGYGLWAVAQGWHLLPASLLLKGTVPDPSSPGSILNTLRLAGLRLLGSSHVLAPALVAAEALRRMRRDQGEPWRRAQPLLVLFLGTTALHMEFAAIGWFFRYEAYLVALGIVALAALLAEGSPAVAGLIRLRPIGRALAGIAVAAVLLPAVARGAVALDLTPRASNNIYDQHYQMALFLKAFYPDAAIAANDIGAINYVTDLRLLDLHGLGSLEVINAKQSGQYNTARIAELARLTGARIAIAYDTWLADYGGAPAEWTRVGQWRISDNVVCSSATVSFYALDPAEAPRLRANLRAFADRLPPDVAQLGSFRSDA